MKTRPFICIIVFSIVYYIGSNTRVNQFARIYNHYFVGLLEESADSKTLLVEYSNGEEASINPGCISRKIADYIPRNSGFSQHHPTVIHYAKLTMPGEAVSLSFMDYMSMMSVYKFLKPEKIFIHAYDDIVGKYWQLIQKWKGTSLIVNKVRPLANIGGKSVEYEAHKADYIRLVALLKFGGIISDFDVIIINGTKIREMQKLSECIISKEEDYLNIGFVSCIKNSMFVKRWIDSYHSDFRPSSYLYNSAFKPIVMLEDRKYCCNCYVEDTICLPSNKKENKMKWLQQNGVQWKSKPAAHYFLKSEFTFNDDRLLMEKHSLGEMLQYVNNSPYPH